MPTIDINSDLGEGFGPYHIAEDAALMPRITSANIACGGHAGDPIIMDDTVALAGENGVRIGAHIGYPDRTGFGRRAMTLSIRELELLTVTQLGTLRAIAERRGKMLSHANFHGALGNLSFRDKEAANALLGAMKAFDPNLKFIGLPDTEATRAAEALGIEVVHSFLADRGYTARGRLASRGTEGSVIKDPSAVRRRVADTISSGLLTLVDGRRVPTVVDSVLVHSDTPNALDLAEAIRAGILDAGVTIAPYA